MGSDVDPDGVYPVPDTGKKNAKLISNNLLNVKNTFDFQD